MEITNLGDSSYPSQDTLNVFHSYIIDKCKKHESTMLNDIHNYNRHILFITAYKLLKWIYEGIINTNEKQEVENDIGLISNKLTPFIMRFMDENVFPKLDETTETTLKTILMFLLGLDKASE